MGDQHGENSIDLGVRGQLRDTTVPQVSLNETGSNLRQHANGDSRDTRDTSDVPAVVPRRVSWSAAELLATDFAEPRWAVPRIVAEGLTVLAGAPKVGKSWLSLGLGIAASTGGKALGRIEVDQGPALYLALEDTPRRLKSRLEKITAGDAHPGLGELTIAVECPPLPAGGDQQIAAWLDRHRDARLVVIDVLSKIRGAAGVDIPQYDRDYAAVARAKALADHYGVAIVIVHHTRKMASDDWMDEVSGTRGISGAADAVLSLKRSRGEADGILSVTGRDVEEAQLALSFSADLGSWHLLDVPVSEIILGDTRRAILNYTRGHEGARPKEISDDLHLDYELTKKTCARMVKDDQLDSDGKGRHFVPITRDSAAVPGVPAVPAAGQSTSSQGHLQGHLSPEPGSSPP
jgi:AAA domain